MIAYLDQDIKFLAGVGPKRAELLKHPDTIHDIMKAGAAKARAKAEATMADVRRRIGLVY